MRNGSNEAVIFKGRICVLGGGVTQAHPKHLREVHSPASVGLLRRKYTMPR